MPSEIRVYAALGKWDAKHDIWLVTYTAMVAVVVMGIGPIRRAYDADRAKLNRGAAADE